MSFSAVVIRPLNQSSAFTVRLPLAPSHTNSKPSAIAVAGMSAAGSAWASEPPIVPLLRTAGSPITAAHSATTGTFALSTLDDSTSQCVVMAPMTIVLPSSLMPVSPLTLRRSIRFLGWARRSFIIGMQAVAAGQDLGVLELAEEAQRFLARCSGRGTRTKLGT